MSPELLEEFLAQPYVAVIATLKASGEPYTVPIVFVWEDGCFYFSGTYSRVWCKHLLRNPAMSLSIEAQYPHYGHVGCEGHAEAIQDPPEEVFRIIRKIFDKSPPNAPPEEQEMWWERLRAEPRLAFRLRPEKLRAIDMNVYEGKRGDREHQAAHGIDPAGRKLPPPTPRLITSPT
jgi:nitroimidazol reductase NimA-like FMN-containing flavoprotein (pyridoxamine 5'-phosphate oxidase superfamily)